MPLAAMVAVRKEDLERRHRIVSGTVHGLNGGELAYGPIDATHISGVSAYALFIATQRTEVPLESSQQYRRQ